MSIYGLDNNWQYVVKGARAADRRHLRRGVQPQDPARPKEETMLYIGVDLGTSAVKLLLMDGSRCPSRRSSPGSIPFVSRTPAGLSKTLRTGCIRPWTASRELTAQCDRSQIAGIGCGGQMHGLVVLDEHDQVLRPAILWNDGRHRGRKPSISTR